jgi:gamma-glutamyltranspeptidase/glutathione hydrolase
MNSAVGDGPDFLVNDPTWALDFAPNGTRLGVGDTITRRRYADTLEVIAQQGPGAFYSGPIAETMINALQRANGTMTLEDLRDYDVAIRNISQIDYRGYTITSTSAPSSGIVAMSILKILDTYKDFFSSEKSVDLSTHRMDEAMRFGYGEVRLFLRHSMQLPNQYLHRERNSAILCLSRECMNMSAACWTSPPSTRFIPRSPTFTH